MASEPDTDSVADERRAEYEGLVDLLMAHAVCDDDRTRALAERVAIGCLGPGHLWREMHLGSRAELRALLERDFPELAAGNDRDMRWKRYLYSRLCGWPGFHG